MEKPVAVIDRLIAHFGGRLEAASKLGLGREGFRLWRRDGIPLSRSLDIEAVTEGAITAEDVIGEARSNAL